MLRLPFLLLLVVVFIFIPVANLPAQIPQTQGIVYAKTAQGAELKLDVYVPEGDKVAQPCPVLLRLSPTREKPTRPGNELRNKGYVVIYAGYLPEDGGGGRAGVAFNRFPADLHAAKAAVRWIRGNAAAYHFDPERIGVWGAGHGGTLTALVALTADQKDLAGNLGDFPNESCAVRTACLLGGTTDWRNAELYGDETVNLPGSPAYQLFGGNPKDFPEDARRASAVNYVRPNSPPVLMITLASDANRAMHLIFAETLHRAGVASALYEEAAGAGLGGRAVDEAKLDKTIIEFFADTLSGKTAPANLAIEQEIAQLTGAGLFKQARRIVEEQVATAAAGAAGAGGGRQVWLKKITEISNQQQVPALEKLAAAMKAFKLETRNPKLETPLWTIREILTDPEHIGEYHVLAQPSAREFDRIANALKQVEILNALVQNKDFAGADKQAKLMGEMSAKEAHGGTMQEFLVKYNELRAHPDAAWPAKVKPVVGAFASGQDLYGFWFTLRAGGVMQRFRFIPPGKFNMGSSKDEWSRLPGEPILEPTEIKQGFWLAECTVTQEMWEGIMGASENRSPFKDKQRPADSLSYAHAVNFLNKVGLDARLPTEAEFEYACRAGSSQMYAGTGRLSDMAWCWDEATSAPHANAPDVRILYELETQRTELNAFRSTHPVKQKLPNRWGLYDMQGNVWQWCAGSSAEKRDYHPARGGSWISIPQSCRAARSTWFPVEQASWNLGMRILVPAGS